MENNFLKVGNSVSFKTPTNGLDYSLEGGKIYNVIIDDWNGTMSLEIAPDLQLPSKIYTTENEDKFCEKVLKYYDKLDAGTVGVMLSGLKGSGKTVMAKNIAVQSNLPIILIDKSIRPKTLQKLFSKLSSNECCFIFDEIDKLGEDYDDDYLLKILDGVNTCGKNLLLCTCNNEDNISEYLKDRCSRIRYWKKFDELSPFMIQKILDDILDDKDEIKPLTEFILNNFKCVSFDNIYSFAEEVNMCPTETFENLFADMNLMSK